MESGDYKKTVYVSESTFYPSNERLNTALPRIILKIVHMEYSEASAEEVILDQMDRIYHSPIMFNIFDVLDRAVMGFGDVSGFNVSMEFNCLLVKGCARNLSRGMDFVAIVHVERRYQPGRFWDVSKMSIRPVSLGL